MTWIQYTLPFRIKTILLIVTLLPVALTGYCQDKVVLNLTKLSPSLFKSGKFYIQEVEDKRKESGTVLGKVISYGKETPIHFPEKADKLLLKYWSAAVLKNKEAYLPLYITVKELQINEKRVAPNKVTGEIKLAVTFRWYRNMQPVELTNYQTSANYTRPEQDFIYEKLAVQLLTQSLGHFNKWMLSNAGKNPALARNVLLVFKEINNKNEPDTVFYDPKRPLVWADFKGQSSKPGSRYAAAVFTSFGYEGRSYPKDDDLVIEIGLKIFMVKSMSWGRADARTASTLRHEQLHFDVTRMVVERFKDRLKKAELTIEDFDSEIQYQFLEVFRDMNTEQEAYDGQTGHGLNAAAQAEWDRKISNQISAIYSVQQ
jgi:hypothetical protein